MAAFEFNSLEASFMSFADSTSAYARMSLLYASLLSLAAEDKDCYRSALNKTSFIKMFSTSIPLFLIKINIWKMKKCRLKCIKDLFITIHQSRNQLLLWDLWRSLLSYRRDPAACTSRRYSSGLNMSTKK